MAAGDGIPLTQAIKTVFSGSPAEGNPVQGCSDRSLQEESTPEETQTKSGSKKRPNVSPAEETGLKVKGQKNSEYNE